MTSLETTRREQTRIRRALRRRRHLRAGAVTALGSVAVLGVSGAALGGAGTAGLRASAGMQLVNLASPLLASGGTVAADAESVSGDTGNSEPGAATPPASPSATSPDAVSQARGHADSPTAAPAAPDSDQPAGDGAQQVAEAEAAAVREAEEAAARAAVPEDNPTAAKDYAAALLPAHGWDPSQLTCLDRLWVRESEWLTSAVNPSSGAYGIAQALPGEKMASAGADWKVSYRTQITWGLNYIGARYGSPCGALNFHYANNWY